jgi:hypothetical protein
MNTLLNQLLNTPDLMARNFRLVHSQGRMVLRDMDGYCPLCALAEIQGHIVEDKVFPWKYFQGVGEIHEIVTASDNLTDCYGFNQDTRDKIQQFLCGTVVA